MNKNSSTKWVKMLEYYVNFSIPDKIWSSLQFPLKDSKCLSMFIVSLDSSFFSISIYLKKEQKPFLAARFFSTQPQCCLTFSWIKPQMLLRCCLVHISIIIMRHFLYFLYLCPCTDLGLFMSYLSDPFLFFFSIFTMINRIIWWIQTNLFFYLLFRVRSIIFGWLRGWRMWIIFK